MPKVSRIRLATICRLASWLACWGLALWGSAAGAQIQAELPETSEPAYATSVPFDLQPQVERASFDLRRARFRAIYDAIARAYGIRLLYDEDLREPSRTSDFQLQDVSLPQALEVAGNLFKTFVAPLDEHSGIVAADTAQKREEHERQILGSFHLDDLITPQQLTEISTALRTMLDLRRVTQDTRSNWITVRGRPRQVALAEQLVWNFQKAPGEVVLEVEFWEIDNRRARQLGILPPQQFQLLYLGRSPGTIADPLFSAGGGRTLYGLRLPGAAAQFSVSSSVVRSRQKVQLRATQGQPANLTLGERFPTVAVSVSSGLQPADGSQAANAGAFTGLYPTIQYQDLGLIVKATPYLHANREVTLQLDLALRNVGAGDRNGLPTITNRQLTEQVRLKDGEGYLIGGILNRSDQDSQSGFPWFSRLPLAGYVFGSHGKDQREDELVVLIRPYIVRSSPAETYASPTLFFGKELLGLPPEAAPPVPAAPFPGGPPIPGVPPQPGAPSIPGLPPLVAPPVPGVPPQQPQAIPPGIVVPIPGQPGVAPPGPAIPRILFPPGVMPPSQIEQPEQPQQPQ